MMILRNGKSRLQNFNRSVSRLIGLCKEPFNRCVATVLAVTLLASSCPIGAYAQSPVSSSASGAPKTSRPASQRRVTPVPRQSSPRVQMPVQLPDSIGLSDPTLGPAEVVVDEIDNGGKRPEVIPVDTVNVVIDRDNIERQMQWADSVNAAVDSLGLTPGHAATNDSIAALLAQAKTIEDEWVPTEVEFNPDPTKAVWMSALFPGLGQVYNRRYWKLPIIVGGYLGLAYATNWNNNMLRDYTRAYSDLMDNDPNSRSYMDMFSPNVKEENLDRSWLQNVLKSRKNYFRRNRDLCIICMVAVYLLAMVDAYVDASLSHFDVSPDLSMDLAPAMIADGRQRYPSVGLVWALNF